MSTSTIIELVRWRVRDLATCFHACRLSPRADESTDQESKKKMVFDPIGENRRRETNREKLRRKKRDQERDSLDKSSKRITYNSKRINSDKEGMMMGESSSLSRFDEEEYIVFCFRDDGEIHVVKEKRPCHHDQIDRPKRRSRAVNHLKCDESAAENSNSSHVEDITTISDEQVEGERNDVEVDWPPDEIKDINQTGTPESKMSSVAESSDSNQSDASTGSFAFPILGWEWMGSPVHMPKPEDTHLRKHKAWGVRLHCCRF